MGEPVWFFTPATAARLAGISHEQLRYWQKTGVFVPEHREEQYAQIFTFRDLVGLRTLADIRREGVSLQHLRVLGRKLSAMGASSWSSMRFFVLNRRLFFERPDTSQLVESKEPHAPLLKPTQYDLRRVEQVMRRTVEAERQRPKKSFGKVVRDRRVLGNAWRIAGTRIRTATVWNLHEAGWSRERIIEEYPRLTRQDVDAAIRHERQIRRRKVA